MISMRENEYGVVGIPSSTVAGESGASWSREQYLNACRLLINRTADDRGRLARNGRPQAYQYIDDVNNTKVGGAVHQLTCLDHEYK